MKTPKKTLKKNSGSSGKKSRARAGNDIRELDPFLERERSRYESPLPSREHILAVLMEQGVPISVETLAQLLSISEQENQPFERRLAPIQRDGQIMRNRKDAICVVDKLDLIKDRVQGHGDGSGFLVREDDGEDLFLNPGEMSKVLHGDRVVAREGAVNARGRCEGHIVEVLERANRKVVGRFLKEH